MDNEVAKRVLVSKRMTRRGFSTLLGAMLVGLAQASWAQKVSSWRVYRLADGLRESACVSVAIAPQGKVLVNHFNVPFISILDGYSVTNLSVPNAANCRIYESPGGQLWTVALDGLQEYQDGVWLLHPVAEISGQLAGVVHHPIDPIPLAPLRQGQVLFLLPERLSLFNCESPDHPRTELLREATQTGLGRFSGLGHAHDGGLWIAGERGLARIPGPIRNPKPDGPWQEFLPPASMGIHNFQEPHESEDGSLTMVAESTATRQKVIAHFDGQSAWTTLVAGSERIRLGWRGPDSTTWGATMDALYQWNDDRSELVENEEISARQYFDVAVEPAGAFWLATADGLYRYAPLAWRHPPCVRNLTSVIHGLASDTEGRIWFVAAGELHSIQNGRNRAIPFPKNLDHSVQAAGALFPLRDGSLLLQAGGQLVQFQPRTEQFQVLAPGVERPEIKPLGLLRDGKLLCLEKGAVPSAQQPRRLETFDGIQFQEFPYPLPDSALGTNLTTLYVAQNGDLWASAEHGTAWYHEKKWRLFLSSDGSAPEAALRFTELGDGRIWCATLDRIWEFDNKGWFTVRGGFDRINELISTRDTVWVASNTGVHRFIGVHLFSKGAWVENGVEEGLASTGVREICEDTHGLIWAGTTRGLSLYDPNADRDAPRAYVLKLPETEKNLPEGANLTLAFNGIDKWKYTPRERLLYSYRLDGRDWSPFQEENTAPFSELAAGKHVFEVLAMDRDCNVDLANPGHLEFTVVQPWYKETRLVLISLAGTAFALFFAGLAFNRHWRLMRSYAEVEKKVNERTRELEIASRELVHSQKMNALGTLAAGIAHDFNNILSIIKGSAQIIDDNLDNPSKIHTRVDRIKTVVEQGAGIVKAMLGFSRDSGQQTGPCDLNTVVQDTIRLLGDRFLREVQIAFQPAASLPPVFASKDFVQQILLNFIFNAAESVPKGKQIILSAVALTELPLDLVLVPAKARTYVAVAVQDFGCGISPENLPRVFEPFFTTKALSARRGTGLGLSMVYELAKRMEAGLAVVSSPGLGSTFTLILPVRDMPAKSGDAAPAPEPSREPFAKAYESSHHSDH